MSADKALRKAQPSTADIEVPDGPWNVDVWHIERPPRYATSGEVSCAVTICDRPAGRADGDPVRDTDVLCIAHRRRYKADKTTYDVAVFVEKQSSLRPILRPRGAMTAKLHFPPVDFRLVSSTLANELRYVTAIKTQRMRWHDPEYIAYVLRGAIELAVEYKITSLLDFPLPPADEKNATARLQTMFPAEKIRKSTHAFVQAFPGMRRLLRGGHGRLLGGRYLASIKLRLLRENQRRRRGTDLLVTSGLPLAAGGPKNACPGTASVRIPSLGNYPDIPARRLDLQPLPQRGGRTARTGGNVA